MQPSLHDGNCMSDSIHHYDVTHEYSAVVVAFQQSWLSKTLVDIVHRRSGLSSGVNCIYTYLRLKQPRPSSGGRFSDSAEPVASSNEDVRLVLLAHFCIGFSAGSHFHSH
jgi:hypothetical protein